MDVTRTAFGTWSGGRFMHFGQPLDEERYLNLVRSAHARGIRTFLTADVYGNGKADEILGQALDGIPRDTYCLAGAVGHDFYTGQREGAKGYPRFTDARLRKPSEYGDYLAMAVEKSLTRCRASRFDLVLLHNPDATGFASDAVWKGMERLKDRGLASKVGIAPGPANGFTLDLIESFERFGGLIQWAMIILNPLEPWPGKLSLPAAEAAGIKLITRVVDYGGLFHDDVRPGHEFAAQDHRAFRPAGWVEAGLEKMEKLRPIAEAHGLSMLQFACAWNLSQPAVHSVVPTLIQEIGTGAAPIESKMEQLAALPEIRLSSEEIAEVEQIGDNKGCMHLKGASPDHQGDPLPDRWALEERLETIGKRWSINARQDLAFTHPAPAP